MVAGDYELERKVRMGDDVFEDGFSITIFGTPTSDDHDFTGG